MKVHSASFPGPCRFNRHGSKRQPAWMAWVFPLFLTNCVGLHGKGYEVKEYRGKIADA